jgi:hypothetical protein
VASTPSDIALAVRRNTEAELAFDDGTVTEPKLRELKDSRASLAALGGVPVEIPHPEWVTAAIQRYLGIAFWDREPVEPTPLEVVKP